MNNTTIAIDNTIEKRVQAHAKKYKIPLSALIHLLLIEFINGRIKINLHNTIDENGFSEQEQDEIMQAIQDKEIIGPFDSANDFISNLHSQKKNYAT
jgi:hypothetical protein